MRALQLIEPGRPLAEVHVPTPEPGPGEVLVQVEAAGICRSDVHYRAGFPRAGPLPLILGHEIAGIVAAVGAGEERWGEGSRVVVHYQLSCGRCEWCRRGSEQFCPDGAMLGMRANGGYAEYVAVPGRNLFPLPAAVPMAHGAVMMCSSATCYHALRKARLRAGETVAVFGAGGLGMSALQLARAFGAAEVFAVDLNPLKLGLAERLGAVPVDAGADDPVAAVFAATGGRGVDVALELIGLPLTLGQALRSLAPMGRAVAVGVGDEPISVAPYSQLLTREAELIGSADHLAQELPGLLDLASRGVLDLSEIVSASVPLEASAVNDAMDRLEQWGDAVRTVIEP